MISPICSSNTETLRECLHKGLRPYAEGLARVNRAWSGVDFHSIYNTRLSLGHRIISLLVGALLLIPFFNWIIWRGWETFGHPEILSDPYTPGEKKKTARAQPTASPRIEVTKQMEPPSRPVQEVLSISSSIPFIKKLKYSETTDGKTVFSDWDLEWRGSDIHVEKKCPDNIAKSRFDLDWQLQEYLYTSSDGKDIFHTRLEGNKIHLKASIKAQLFVKEFTMPKTYPWIQQVTLGFKKFVLSAQKTLNFYGINPMDRTLTHMVAKKKEKEEFVEGLGKLVKVDLNIAGWRSFFWKGELWLDPQTGDLRKMVSNSGPFTPVTTTLFIPEETPDKK